MLFGRPTTLEEESDLIHNKHDPFCSDPTCHEDDTLIDAVAQQVEDGLLTPDEATRFVQGRQL